MEFRKKWFSAFISIFKYIILLKVTLDFTVLINFSVETYFVQQSIICVFWDGAKDSPSFLQNSTDKSFVLIENGNECKTEENLLKSLNLGCEVFFVTISVVLKFLNLHRQLQEAAVRKNAVKYLIILSEHDDPDKEEILEEVCGHISIDRKNFF